MSDRLTPGSSPRSSASHGRWRHRDHAAPADARAHARAGHALPRAAARARGAAHSVAVRRDARTVDRSRAARLYRHDRAVPRRRRAGRRLNAASLPIRPTAHADAAYLATRADDTLYDGIASGGAILNRSHLDAGLGRYARADADPRAGRAPARAVRLARGGGDRAASPSPAASSAPPCLRHRGPSRLRRSRPRLARRHRSGRGGRAVPAAAAASRRRRTFFRDFVGADACRPCHAEQYDLWAASTHRPRGRRPGRAADRLDPHASTASRCSSRTRACCRRRPTTDRVSFTVKHHDGATEDHRGRGGGRRRAHDGRRDAGFFTRLPDGTLRFLPFDFIRGEGRLVRAAREGRHVGADRRQLRPRRPRQLAAEARILGNAPMFSNCDVCHGSQIRSCPA